MNVLGISCYYHDAAACLIQNGAIAAAAQEERFDRVKYSAAFPIQSINYCLQTANITVYDIDYVVFYEKPYLKFSRVLLSHIKSFPFSFPNFLETMPQWLQDRLIFPLIVKRETGYEGKVLYVKHHLSHAASAFFSSSFDEAAILTADSVGEWATATIGYGKGRVLSIIKELQYPNSLGLIYTAVTTFLGFKALDGEGTVMGLAGYGQPRYLSLFKEIVSMKPDGSFTVNPDYFSFNQGRRMYTAKFIEKFGKERTRDDKIEERHCDIAASLQKLTEEILVAMVHQVYQLTRQENLCLAGGLFLNCVANTRILNETPFKNIFIQPAAGDAGGALGAAAYIARAFLGEKKGKTMTDAYFGPEFSSTQIKRAIAHKGLIHREMDSNLLYAAIAKKLSENKIVGWFQGRMEFGPRALGNRSILGDPRNAAIKDFLNSKVKQREPFRPFAPVVLEERASDYFDLKGVSPFMLLAPQVIPSKASQIPAIVHRDGTARVQTVARESNEPLYRLIVEFEKLTGLPMLINTSFNTKGEPIVCTPAEAIETFNKTGMDLLVLGNCVVEKPV